MRRSVKQLMRKPCSSCTPKEKFRTGFDLLHQICNTAWIKQKQTIFYSFPQMAFGVGDVQIKFLHLLSSEASHSITVRWLIDPPHGTTFGTHSNGPIPSDITTLRFLGWNKQLFQKGTLLEPKVLRDERKVISKKENQHN